jgi:hypothetical protein
MSRRRNTARDPKPRRHGKVRDPRLGLSTRPRAEYRGDPSGLVPSGRRLEPGATDNRQGSQGFTLVCRYYERSGTAIPFTLGRYRTLSVPSRCTRSRAGRALRCASPPPHVRSQPVTGASDRGGGRLPLSLDVEASPRMAFDNASEAGRIFAVTRRSGRGVHRDRRSSAALHLALNALALKSVRAGAYMAV